MEMIGRTFEKILIAIIILVFISACTRETRNENGVLLYENLREKYVKGTETVYLFKFSKKMGPYMFLGDEIYTGSIVKYYDNGQVEFEGYYDHGSRAENWKFYYPDGKIQKQTFYQTHPKCETRGIGYYENGNPEYSFITLREECDTVVSSKFYEDGDLKYHHLSPVTDAKREIIIGRRADGEMYKYLDSDSIYISKFVETLITEVTGFYKSGKRNGSWQRFNDDGSNRYHWQYVDGKRDGKAEAFFYGRKTGTEYYYHGDKTGEWIGYHVNGSIKSKTNYLRNKKDGLFISFYEDGTVNETGDFYAGRKVGTWKRYSPDGILERTDNFDR